MLDNPAQSRVARYGTVRHGTVHIPVAVRHCPLRYLWQCAAWSGPVRDSTIRHNTVRYGKFRSIHTVRSETVRGGTVRTYGVLRHRKGTERYGVQDAAGHGPVRYMNAVRCGTVRYVREAQVGQVGYSTARTGPARPDAMMPYVCTYGTV